MGYEQSVHLLKQFFLMPSPLVLAACHKNKLESQIHPPLKGQPLNKVRKDRLHGLRIAPRPLFLQGSQTPSAGPRFLWELKSLLG